MSATTDRPAVVTIGGVSLAIVLVVGYLLLGQQRVLLPVGVPGRFPPPVAVIVVHVIRPRPGVP